MRRFIPPYGVLPVTFFRVVPWVIAAQAATWFVATIGQRMVHVSTLMQKDFERYSSEKYSFPEVLLAMNYDLSHQIRLSQIVIDVGQWLSWLSLGLVLVLFLTTGSPEAVPKVAKPIAKAPTKTTKSKPWTRMEIITAAGVAVAGLVAILQVVMALTTNDPAPITTPTK